MLRHVMTAAALALFGLSSAQAQTYPNQPITVIVPYAPGGNTDVVGRIVTEQMSAILGQKLVIENIGGAGGTTGSLKAARATPDGYTLIYNSLNHTINSLVMKQPGYDPVKDFAPITLVQFSPSVLVVGTAQPWNSVQDLVQAAKGSPGSITFGSAGVGGSAHLTAELLRAQAGANMTHVPFRGNGPALVDVIAGQVSFIFHPMGGLQDFVASRRVRALGITTAQRHPQFPEVPTMKELGFSGFEEAHSWSGMLAPAGTSAAIVDKLSAILLKSMESGGMKKRAETYGTTLVGGTPEDFRRFLVNDAERWRRVIRNAGIRPE